MTMPSSVSLLPASPGEAFLQYVTEGLRSRRAKIVCDLLQGVAAPAGRMKSSTYLSVSLRSSASPGEA